MLHGSCHVLDSFCAGIELCSTACKKLELEKNLYQIDRYTRKFLVQDDLYRDCPVSILGINAILSTCFTF